MFQIHKKPNADTIVKKSVQKVLDPKKDLITRLKHLKLVLENVADQAEAQAIFEQYYSHIYYVFYENYLIAESNVRQKGAHRAQREELENVLQIFETILTNLPDMIHERWQYKSIDRVIKSLLHPGNSLKLRREGIKLFLLWFRALRENADESTFLLYALLVPGFPAPQTADARYKNANLEFMLNPPLDNQVGICPAEITFLVPPPAGEKSPDDSNKYFLDAVLEFMVTEACQLHWKNGDVMHKISFSFLWDMFKKYYLGHIFQDFHFDTSLYQPDLSLPEPRDPIKYILNITESGGTDSVIEIGAGCPMIATRVSMIKWIVVFTSNVLKEEYKTGRLPEKTLNPPANLPSTTLTVPEQDGSHSNTSTLTDKAPSLTSLSSLDDKLKFSGLVGEEEQLVRDVLYSTRENVNIVHEIFRQALILPLTEVKTMRRVIKAYQEWIQDGFTPIFMENPEIIGESEESPGLKEGGTEDDEDKMARKPSTSSLRNVSYIRGLLHPMIDEAQSNQVRAGCQTTYQLFITNSAHVFLVEPPNDAQKLVQAQVDICKRVLNIYRHMVMHVTMDSTTWTQLLQVLLHITRIMLQDTDSPNSIRVTTVAGKLAGPVFQTLIVSWIKANLFVHVSRELWDELVDVLSSLLQWRELINEWAKNMDTMTRVLARHVYGLELSDLPLDRLTEQKQMRNRKLHMKEKNSKNVDKSFSKGLDKESPTLEKGSIRFRSHTTIGGGLDTSLLINQKQSTRPSQDPIEKRGRSVTVTGLDKSVEPTLKNKPSSTNDLPSHQPLKRGRSDTSNLSTSPTLEDNNLLSLISNKNDSLHRSSSTSDLTTDKVITKVFQDGHEGNSQSRHRCNSGPGFHKRPSQAEKVHGLTVEQSDDDRVTSLSSVEDAFNDMFDELAQQRLSITNVKFEGLSLQSDVVSIKSHDSGSIDPTWNPFSDTNGASEDHLQEQFLHGRVDQVQYTDLRDEDEEEWGSCLEDSNFDTSSEAAGLGIGSPHYHVYKHSSRDRYDSTALLIPESRSRLRNTMEETIAETDDANSDCQDTILEKSSDDILGVHCSTPHHNYIRQISLAHSELVSDGDDDAVAEKNKTDSLLIPNDDRSILAGGRRTGWYPEVAVALWRRLLGVLGDVNKVTDPVIHRLIFQHLLKLWDVLFKLRENLGITADNLSTPPPPELVPPLRIMSPWAFKAVLSPPDQQKGGHLHAYELLCKTTLQNHDTRLEPEHLALFYLVLHEGLHSDQDKVNEIVRCSSPKFFSCGLPASTLLLLDFIYACHAVAASSDLTSPRVEAQTLLGSVLCFPNLYFDLPVLNPDSKDPQVVIRNNIKEYVSDALLTSAKKEPSAPARCVALSSLGIWLYEELTSPVDESNVTQMDNTEFFGQDSSLSPVKGRILARHGRVKEAINVLLVSLKFNNRVVACIACSQLHLLTHCVSELIEYMPEMPSRIIEVMSLTASSLLQNSEAKSSESGRRLLVTLLLCICDWCMAVPMPMLIESTLPGSDKRLIRTVFKALQTGALGKPGHSAKHSYSLSDLASKDFDPNLQLDKVSENVTAPSSSNRNSKLTLPPMPNVSVGSDNVISLTASTVLSHLTNHLGHFPLSKGPAVLNSLVTEQQDHGSESDKSADLSHDLFKSPNVQFLIYNDTCIMSIVEIPTKENGSDNEVIGGLVTSPTTVRIIVRDTNGKFCWDFSILYGSSDIKQQTKPVSVVPPSTLHTEISKVISEHCRQYMLYAEAELQKKKRVVETPLPSYDRPLAAHATDRLDEVLQYIGYSSPECQLYPGKPLNIPGPGIGNPKMEETAMKYLLTQHQNEVNQFSKNSVLKSYQSVRAQPQPFCPPRSPFYQSRLLISQTAFLSKENRRCVTLLKKNERLLRELKNLDSRSCRETHKVAVIYIASGQEDKLSILSNTAASKDFEDFVSGLGWEVDLKTHCGFRGKLHSDGSTGATAPYYATSILEVVFHVSTRFPSTDDDSRNTKLKHLGNDEVHIVWSEHSRDYRRGIIPTEFGDVLIIIYPMRHKLYRIQIKKKDEVPYFGPLFDGAIVNARVLPVLVRETAINAGRAKRSQLSLYQPFYEERAKYLHQIIDQFRDDTTFEEYAAHLFCPAQVEKRKSSKRLSTKRPAPKPASPIPPSSAENVSSSPTSITSTPNITTVKTLPLTTQSNSNNVNNNNHILSPVLEDSPSKSRHLSDEYIPPLVKDPPHLEKEAGPKYTPGHAVSGSGKSSHAVSSTLQMLSSKLTSSNHIATPRPKPSSTHASSISSLFPSLHHQQVPTQATSIPSSTKIHIPVSKMQSSSRISAGPPKRQSSTPIKSSLSTKGSLLIPPPSGTKSTANHNLTTSTSLPSTPSVHVGHVDFK